MIAARQRANGQRVRLPRHAHLALQFALGYALLATAWIYFSDRIAFAFLRNAAELRWWSTSKGWIFVTITALLVFIGVRRTLGRIHAAYLDAAEAQERFRALIDASSTVVWRAAPDGTPIDSIPDRAEYTGMPDEQFARPHGWREAFHPDDCDRIVAEWQHAVASGQEYRSEYRMRRGDGTWRHMRAHAVPVRNEDGSIREWFGIDSDVTEQKEATEALRLQSHILNSIGDAVIATDIAGKVIYMNRAAEQLYGWRAEEALGREASSIDVPKNGRADAEAIMQTLRAGGTWNGQFPVHDRNGRRFVIEATMTALRGNEGEVTAVVGVSRDVSDRKQAEHELEKQQVQLEEAQALAEMGTWEWDIAGNELVWSAEMARILGRGEQRITAEMEDFQSLLHPEDASRVENVIADAVAGNREYDVTFRIIRSDGTQRVLHSRGRVILDGHNAPRRMFGMAQDVTERHAAEEALRESERRFRQVAENIDEVFWVVDIEKEQSLYVSPAYESIWGRSVESLKQNMWSFMDAVVDEDRASVNVFNTKERSQNAAVTYRIRRPDGSVRWIHDRAFPVRDENGRVYRVAGIAEDITLRKETEAALAQYREELRALAERSNEIREEEAIRISRELHDELGQALTRLTFDVAAVQKRVVRLPFNGERDAVDAHLRQITSGLHETIRTTRRICTELRPAILDHLGLAAAIEWQTKEFEARTGILCDLLLPESEVTVEEGAATATFRIFQELLTNIARHANATEAHVELKISSGNLELLVHDNGRGITDAEAQSPSGLGLVGVRERVKAAGGHITIRRGKKRGTVAILHLPLEITGYGET